MDSRQQIIELIRSTVRTIVANAHIILFGSRARGNCRADSDWDVLVLVYAPQLNSIHKSIDYQLWQRGLD